MKELHEFLEKLVSATELIANEVADLIEASASTALPPAVAAIQGKASKIRSEANQLRSLLPAE